MNDNLKQKFKNLIYFLRTNRDVRIISVFIAILFSISSIIILFEEKADSGLSNIGDSIWWAIVTVTTVGYGDRCPSTPGGRIVGVLLMIVGVAAMGMITGKIASLLTVDKMKEGRGLSKLSQLEGHFIICGWRRDMIEFLIETLLINKTYTANDLVLINMHPPEEVEHLKTTQELKLIHYINGDFVEDAVLLRANIKKAKRLLILADLTGGLSPQEVDARTVMTIFTAKSMNKNIFTCAEIINPKFKKNLEISHCDEIVLSTEYAKMLLSNASTASGISHIVSEFLSPHSETRLITVHFPLEFIGKTFAELAQYFRHLDGSILVGLLENAGNIFERKREALKVAQRTPDISKLVKSLQQIKVLVANEPVLNPGYNYIVKEHTKAIIIEPKQMSRLRKLIVT